MAENAANFQCKIPNIINKYLRERATKIRDIFASNLQVANKNLQFSNSYSIQVIYANITIMIQKRMLKSDKNKNSKFKIIITLMLVRKQTNLRQPMQQIHNPIIHCLFEKQYQIIYTPSHLIVFSVVMALIFLALTAISFFLAWSVQKIQVQYANQGICTETDLKTQICHARFTVGQDINQPLYLMYVVKNIYVNHKKFLNSQSYDQLIGKLISVKQAEHECSPIVFNKDIPKKYSWAGVQLKPQQIASPCGLKAQGFFNDTFRLYSNGQIVQIKQQGIYRGSAIVTYPGIVSQINQWINPVNQNFKLYLLDSSLMSRKRVWGVLQNGLRAGDYQILISNNFQMPDQKMSKGVILTTTTIMGGKEYFYSAAFGIITCMCILLAIIAKISFRQFKKLQQKYSYTQ